MKIGIARERGVQSSKERAYFVHDDEESVLMFWSVFGAITFVNEYLEVFLSWLPLYYVSKCTLLAFLSTSTDGSRFLFRILAPIVQAQAELYAPYLHSRASSVARKLHSNLINFSLESADDAELDRLHRAVKHHLSEIKMIRHENVNRTREGPPGLPLPTEK